VLCAWIDRLYHRYESILQKESLQTGLNVTYDHEDFEKTHFEPIASLALVSVEQRYKVFSNTFVNCLCFSNNIFLGKIR